MFLGAVRPRGAVRRAPRFGTGSCADRRFVGKVSKQQLRAANGAPLGNFDRLSQCRGGSGRGTPKAQSRQEVCGGEPEKWTKRGRKVRGALRERDGEAWLVSEVRRSFLTHGGRNVVPYGAPRKPKAKSNFKIGFSNRFQRELSSLPSTPFDSRTLFSFPLKFRKSRRNHSLILMPL